MGPPIDFNSTDVWLTEVLGENTLKDAAPRQVAEAIVMSGNERWREFPQDWANLPLIVSFAGWDLVTRKPFGKLVSNCLTTSGQPMMPSRNFVADALPPGRCHIVGWIDEANRRLEERALAKIVRRNRGKDSSIDAIVSTVRRAAREPDVVSPDPVVVWIPKDGQATAHYCPPDVTAYQFTPSYVYCTSQAGYSLGGGYAEGKFDPGDRIIIGDHRTPQSVIVTPNPKPKVKAP